MPAEIGTGLSSIQRDGFIAVDGADLKSRMDAAIKLGRSSSSTKFWTAYSFDVRPGVAVDAEVVSGDGSRTFVQSASVSRGAPAETRNLGVFLLPVNRAAATRLSGSKSIISSAAANTAAIRSTGSVAPTIRRA